MMSGSFHEKNPVEILIQINTNTFEFSVRNVVHAVRSLKHELESV